VVLLVLAEEPAALPAVVVYLMVVLPVPLSELLHLKSSVPEPRPVPETVILTFTLQPPLDLCKSLQYAPLRLSSQTWQLPHVVFATVLSEQSA